MSLKNDPLSDFRSMMLMLASVVLFAANTLLIKAVSLHTPMVDGWLVSLFRGIVGLVVVFALHGQGRGLQPERLFSSRLVALRGIVGGLAIVLLYITVIKMGVARAIILNLTYPVFASVIAALWLKEKLNRASFFWMLIGLVGLAVFLSGDGKLLHPSPYDLLALIGAAGAGWVVVIIRKLRHEEHPATIYASQAFYSMALACPTIGKIQHLPTGAWVGLAAAAVVVTFAQLVMTRSYQTMSVAKGSSVQMLLPIAVGIGGYFFFGERFHLLEIAGATLTLVATWRVIVAK